MVLFKLLKHLGIHFFINTALYFYHVPVDQDLIKLIINFQTSNIWNTSTILLCLPKN